jgi:hypothetical protein
MTAVTQVKSGIMVDSSSNTFFNKDLEDNDANRDNPDPKRPPSWLERTSI